MKEKTRENCTLRGDWPKSVEERVASIGGEAPAWKELIEKRGATEYVGWEFPEYLYKQDLPRAFLVRHQKDILIKAREHLLSRNPRLNIFFKSEDEIRQVKEPTAK